MGEHIMDKNINPIPMLTWNHLKVNKAGDEFMLPVVPEGGSGSSRVSVTCDEGSTASVVNDSNAASAIEVISAAGGYYDEYIAAAAGHVYSINATGDSGTVREETVIAADSPAAVTLCNINAAEGSSVRLIRVIRSDDDVEGVAMNLTRIKAEKGSNVIIISINLTGDKTGRWESLAIDQDEDSHVDVIRVELGSATSAVGSRSILKGDRSDYTISTVYFLDGERHADINDIAEFYGRDTHSDIRATGVLAGSAHKVLRETVDFKRGAVHAVGHEGEDVVMFGDGSVNKTVPLILCGEEWVEGQHGTTTSRLDPRMLYYLESRGLAPSEAKRIMIDAKLCPVTDRIPDEGLREEIAEMIGRRLDGIDEFNI